MRLLYIEVFLVMLYAVPLSLLAWPLLRRLAVSTYRILAGGYRMHCAYTGTKAWTGLLLSIGLAPRHQIMEVCKSTSEHGRLTLLEDTRPIPLRLVSDNNSLWPTEYGEPMAGTPGQTHPENAA